MLFAEPRGFPAEAAHAVDPARQRSSCLARAAMPTWGSTGRNDRSSRHLSAWRLRAVGDSVGSSRGTCETGPPASDAIDPRDRREIETYGVVERTVDGAIFDLLLLCRTFITASHSWRQGSGAGRVWPRVDCGPHEMANPEPRKS